MQPLISVVVPIYKVEEYMSRCVDSIINQTYKNLEIILVDDGSPDNCPAMCDDFAKKDNRIKVVHKKNGGLSDARNAGMAQATGDFISFIDSDDWVDVDMIETLVNKALENSSDIVSCGVRMVWENDQPSKMLTKNHEEITFTDTESALYSFVKSEYLIQTVWNKLYKKSVIQDIPFPYGKINEDEYWSWKAISRARTITSIDKPMYNYLQRNGSIMRGGSKFDPMNVINAKLERNLYIKETHPSIYDQFCLDLLYTCLFQAQRARMILSKEKYRKNLKSIKVIAKNNCPSKSFLKELPVSKRVRVFSISKCFGLVCLLQNLLNIGNKSNI